MEEIKRGNLYQVPLSRLKLLDDFNDRQDYGTIEEMNELAESIYKVGVQNPIKGFKDGDFYVVISGHRRMKAGEMIRKKYAKETVYPLITYPQKAGMKEYLIDTLLTNSGKDLTPLEKASAVDKLLGTMATIEEIAEALGGVSTVYVRNLAALWKAPEEAKKLIRDGVISATTLMGFLRSKDTNLDEMLSEIQKQAKNQPKAKDGAKPGKKGKKAAVTAKDLPKKKKTTSVDMFMKFRSLPDKSFGSQDKENMYTIMCAIVDNKCSFKQIEAFFTTK